MSDQQSLISPFFVKNRPTEEKQTSQTQRREESDVEMTSESDTSGDLIELFKQLIEHFSPPPL